MLIAVSSGSFHDDLYAGKLHLSEVPFRVYDLGYRAVELQDLFLWPRPPGWLARRFGRTAAPRVPGQYDRTALLRTQLNRHRSGTQLVCWSIDSDLASEDVIAQKAYLAAALGAAHFLHAPLVRLTLGGAPDDRAGLARAVELLRNVLPVAMAFDLKLAIEPRGGARQCATLLELVERFHSPYVGVCLDFGNLAEDRQSFPTTLGSLAPYTIHVHAQSRAFAANGEEATIDYRACLSALQAAHYAGAISIEYAGDEAAAIGLRRTRELIQKYWA